MIKNNVSKREHQGNYNIRNCKVVDIPCKRLPNSQNSYEVFGFKMYSKLKLELKGYLNN